MPVWYWDDTAEALRDCAGEVLRRFVYALVAGGGPFCMAFPFPAATLERKRLTIDERERLDLEDIGLLLGGWAPGAAERRPGAHPSGAAACRQQTHMRSSTKASGLPCCTARARHASWRPQVPARPGR